MQLSFQLEIPTITILADELIVFQASQAGRKVLHAGGEAKSSFRKKRVASLLESAWAKVALSISAFGLMIDKLKEQKAFVRKYQSID
jgi:hypothetical protein